MKPRKRKIASYVDTLPAEINYRRPYRGRVFTVQTYLPRPVALQARREIYPYPYPKPLQKRGRTIRLALRPTHARLVPAKVKIRLPRRLPLIGGSYVSLADGRINIHSYNQVRRLIDAQEFNRRRYSEYKRNHRKASHGQIDSRGSQRFGSVAHAYRSGRSIDQIADAALAVRAISQARR